MQVSKKEKIPCRGCDRRHVGCHADCADYTAYRVAHEKARAEAHEENAKNMMLCNYVHKRTEKSIKRRIKK